MTLPAHEVQKFCAEILVGVEEEADGLFGGFLVVGDGIAYSMRALGRLAGEGEEARVQLRALFTHEALEVFDHVFFCAQLSPCI